MFPSILHCFRTYNQPSPTPSTTSASTSSTAPIVHNPPHHNLAALPRLWHPLHKREANSLSNTFVASDESNNKTATNVILSTSPNRKHRWFGHRFCTDFQRLRRRLSSADPFTSIIAESTTGNQRSFPGKWSTAETRDNLGLRGLVCEAQENPRFLRCVPPIWNSTSLTSHNDGDEAIDEVCPTKSNSNQMPSIPRSPFISPALPTSPPCPRDISASLAALSAVHLTPLADDHLLQPLSCFPLAAPFDRAFNIGVSLCRFIHVARHTVFHSTMTQRINPTHCIHLPNTLATIPSGENVQPLFVSGNRGVAAVMVNFFFYSLVLQNDAGVGLHIVVLVANYCRRGIVVIRFNAMDVNVSLMVQSSVVASPMVFISTVLRSLMNAYFHLRSHSDEPPPSAPLRLSSRHRFLLRNGFDIHSCNTHPHHFSLQTTGTHDISETLHGFEAFETVYWRQPLATAPQLKIPGLRPLLCAPLDYTTYRDRLCISLSTAIRAVFLAISSRFPVLHTAWHGLTPRNVTAAGRKLDLMFVSVGERSFSQNGCDGMDYSTTEQEWASIRGTEVPCGKGVRNQPGAQGEKGVEMVDVLHVELRSIAEHNEDSGIPKKSPASKERTLCGTETSGSVQLNRTIAESTTSSKNAVHGASSEAKNAMDANSKKSRKRNRKRRGGKEGKSGEWTTKCLAPHCGGIHPTKKCPVTSKEEKKRILAAHYEKRYGKS